MELERTFNVKLNQDIVRERVLSYMNLLGYKLITESPWLKFERGTIFGATSLSFKQWETIARIYLNSSGDKVAVNVIIKVNTGSFGKEGFWDRINKAIWLSELDDMELSIISGNMVTTKSKGAGDKAVLFNLIFIFLLIALIVVVVIASIVGLALLTGRVLGISTSDIPPFLIILGAVVGIIIMMILKKKLDRKLERNSKNIRDDTLVY